MQLSNDWLSNELSDERTNGQTNESDFIRRCSTNIECPVEENGFH